MPSASLSLCRSEKIRRLSNLAGWAGRLAHAMHQRSVFPKLAGRVRRLAGSERKSDESL
jgi:hypothetical protein